MYITKRVLFASLIRDSENADYVMSITFDCFVNFDSEETLADDGNA